ncbi:hypothetical protein Cni_G00361 [Canna indica]|uniref:Uncharacterized protein n=1 Tax=Canna indica TaxID=4628 RepID=A0AAQ3JMC5_9LILI|nr:hypothetical protein Cni_G00361 [Canna indica]
MQPFAGNAELINAHPPSLKCIKDVRQAQMGKPEPENGDENSREMANKKEELACVPTVLLPLMASDAIPQQIPSLYLKESLINIFFFYPIYLKNL